MDMAQFRVIKLINFHFHGIKLETTIILVISLPSSEVFSPKKAGTTAAPTLCWNLQGIPILFQVELLQLTDLQYLMVAPK